MKLAATPKAQREHNDDIHRRLKLVAIIAALLIVCAVGLEATLYFSPRPSESGPSLTGPDGTVLGPAFVVTPELVITNIDPPVGSQLFLGGSGRLPLQLIRAESIRGVKLVLLTLQGSYSKEVPQLRGVDNGESVMAISSAGKWAGTLTSSTKDVFDPQPAITLGNMAALIAVNDHALIAVSVPGEAGDIVISTQELLAAFPELGK